MPKWLWPKSIKIRGLYTSCIPWDLISFTCDVIIAGTCESWKKRLSSTQKGDYSSGRFRIQYIVAFHSRKFMIILPAKPSKLILSFPPPFLSNWNISVGFSRRCSILIGQSWRCLLWCTISRTCLRTARRFCAKGYCTCRARQTKMTMNISHGSATSYTSGIAIHLTHTFRWLCISFKVWSLKFWTDLSYVCMTKWITALCECTSKI